MIALPLKFSFMSFAFPDSIPPSPEFESNTLALKLGDNIVTTLHVLVETSSTLPTIPDSVITGAFLLILLSVPLFRVKLS